MSSISDNALFGAVITFTMLFMVFLPLTAHSQEVGIYGSGGFSGNEFLSSPFGAGIDLTLTPVSFIGVRIGLHQQHNRFSQNRTVCDMYWPQFSNCEGESVNNSTRLRTGSLLLILRAPLPFNLQAEAGGGYSLSRVNLDAQTESGRGTGQFVPEGDEQRGHLIHAGVSRTELLGFPLQVFAEYSLHFIEFSGCVTDVAIPFCGDETFSNIKVGLRYRL
ncbi:MAG: hypothetical protein JJU46_06745 [Balneolaceae bacterium]|nr:hypothetical protein [Balneolaceae bacterium]MCH8548956.1 hypothetical protein [Balneolaceae bacterium]